MYNDDNSSESSSAERQPKSMYLTLDDINRIQQRRDRNRVAARSARNRKKARVEKLETRVKGLNAKNYTLQKECSILNELNSKLARENSELRRKMSRNVARNYAGQESSKTHQEQNKFASLSADTLLELWQQVSKVDIPECECNE